MSKTVQEENTLENLYANFQDSLESGDFETAKLIVRDAEILGYNTEAETMKKELQVEERWTIDEQAPEIDLSGRVGEIAEKIRGSLT